MSTLIKWYVYNNTDSYLSIGDLPKVPTIVPPRSNDDKFNLLDYYTMDEIRLSSDLNYMLQSGLLSLVKDYSNSVEELRPTDDGSGTGGGTWQELG